jgi:hypothetical protein
MNNKRCIFGFVSALFSASLFAGAASAVTVASDSASDPAYAAEAGGVWKGQYPNNDQHEANPPGNDNGGMGFEPWIFSGGFHLDDGPYGQGNCAMLGNLA